ncbi:hypothetical protein RSOLAG1IB_07765 [Rhizoctonia solani AG-1 IB]|uniref:Yeast cell wall synthesis Kre9/Knh1-like N-terminal domain-containing protein n=1 Tax=Thanatephorus cucumeris (strain AG1-IB / isolate 7/3/14) TaxID=1108050 RepID=A0A0B7FHE2_THACB|nr:hypothetical protein RSOLAG1IB_07765 [Rhizoctonia solani AG-1 IB]
MLALGFAVVAGAVAGVVAAPNPTEPSGASVFNIGSQCTIKWDVDATGSWKDMSIQLMTGDNWNMIPITTIAQGIDATDATKNTYSYTCPEVTPTSTIYFYQFSSPSDPKNLLWTTRWTLASADGQTTPPTESTQPNGDKIPWGKGALVDPSTAVPPPAYLSGNNQAGGSTNATSSTSAAPITSSTGAAPPATTAPGASSNPVVITSTASANTRLTSSSERAATTGTASASAAANNQTTSVNGALTNGVSGITLVGAFVAALGLF